MYIISFYWSLSTITTVGYGDISAGTTLERIYSLVMMSIGVVSFSFAISSISDIVNKIDSSNAEVNQKIEILNQIKEEYNIDDSIFNKVKTITKYHYNK